MKHVLRRNYNTVNSPHWAWHQVLYSESFDHLEHIHHALSLTALRENGCRREHTRPAHCITAIKGGGGRVRELVDRVGRCSGMHV